MKRFDGLRNISIIGSLALLAISLLIGSSTRCLSANRPTVLVFTVNADEGVDLTLVTTATRAIRDYLRQSGKVEAILFDKKSPLVERAIMDRRVSPEKIENYESQKARAEVANSLSLDYACGARMSVDQEKVKMSMWLIDGANTKRKWEVPDYVAAAGRLDDTGMRNAIQSVASGLVNELVRNAFSKLPTVAPEPTVPVQEDQPAPKPTDTKANATAISNAAADNLKQGNTASAIDLYQKAINVNPSDYTLRIKLAEVYHKRGMDTEAGEELDRAIALGADKTVIETARQRILGVGDVPPVQTEATDNHANPEPEVKTTTTNPSGNTTTTATKPAVNNDINNQSRSLINTSVASGISDGDKLWNGGDAEGAEQAYRQVILNDPKNWQAYERLAILLAAQYRFIESRKELIELNLVQAAPPADVLANRYKWLTQVLDYDVNALLSQMESDLATFESHRVTRESCYESIRTAKTQLQSLVVYADDLLYPPEMRQANANRVQSCRLGAQAATGILEYLETNMVKFKNNAAIFMEQAKVELLEIQKPASDTTPTE